jgi:hypothetical protein
LAFIVNLEPIERDGWASDIAAEFFEFFRSEPATVTPAWSEKPEFFATRPPSEL